ncbi:class I SAM-dependent methyltransferase [Planosporangium thailandense]|uniref:Class I SAM-dependent methyltransferase n=1 Tax=Planosporangium thailandense TaxID=765197 RepID=A0ABX0Y5V6_9ACTN|nr:class I SAM-dependent methyltransferase [Planosporangium thailandense]NJC72792.1 class I SAM-dependent methyltransferase [Planosporangium thailandense]
MNSPERSAGRRLGYQVYRAAALLHRPTEAADRVRGRLERSLDTVLSVRVAPCRERDDRLHELLDLPADAAECAGFDDVWGSITARLPGSCGHDAGAALARTVWTVARHLRPERVVETGVARGVTTSVLLEAMERNGRGALWSIDLPDLSLAWRGEASAAVRPELRRRWTYVRGSSRRFLPTVLARLGSIQLFVHDGLHTHGNMLFEFGTVWRYLSAGGVLLADDVDGNGAFTHFGSWAAAPLLICPEDGKTGAYGLIRKPPGGPVAGRV